MCRAAGRFTGAGLKTHMKVVVMKWSMQMLGVFTTISSRFAPRRIYSRPIQEHVLYLIDIPRWQYAVLPVYILATRQDMREMDNNNVFLRLLPKHKDVLFRKEVISKKKAKA